MDKPKVIIEYDEYQRLLKAEVEYKETIRKLFAGEVGFLVAESKAHSGERVKVVAKEEWYKMRDHFNTTFR